LESVRHAPSSDRANLALETGPLVLAKSPSLSVYDWAPQNGPEQSAISNTSTKPPERDEADGQPLAQTLSDENFAMHDKPSVMHPYAVTVPPSSESEPFTGEGNMASVVNGHNSAIHDSEASVYPLMTHTPIEQTPAVTSPSQPAVQVETVQVPAQQGSVENKKRLLPMNCSSSVTPINVTGTPPKENVGFVVFLHVYDLSNRSSIQWLNHAFGPKFSPLKFGGVFHAGVEVNYHEFSFGAFGMHVSTTPRTNWDHHYRQTVRLPRTQFNAKEIFGIVQDLQKDYSGEEYDLLRLNCCHFADDFCQRLGVGRIPRWVGRFARIGVRMSCLLFMGRRTNKLKHENAWAQFR